jgi:hypothetical protein
MFLAFAVMTLAAFLAHTPPVSLSSNEPEWASPDVASANGSGDASDAKTSVTQVHTITPNQSVLF